MDQIRPPYYVGLAMLIAGLLIMVAWYFIGEPASTNLRFLYGLFFALAAMLIIVGGFLFIAIGMVFLVSLFTQPRAPKSE